MITNKWMHSPPPSDKSLSMIQSTLHYHLLQGEVHFPFAQA